MNTSSRLYCQGGGSRLALGREPCCRVLLNVRNKPGALRLAEKHPFPFVRTLSQAAAGAGRKESREDANRLLPGRKPLLKTHGQVSRRQPKALRAPGRLFLWRQSLLLLLPGAHHLHPQHQREQRGPRAPGRRGPAGGTLTEQKEGQWAPWMHRVSVAMQT